MKIEIDTVNKTLTIKGSFICSELVDFMNAHVEYSNWKIIPCTIGSKFNSTEPMWIVPLSNTSGL